MAALIEIKELHLHVNLQEVSKDAKEILKNVQLILNNMATKQQIQQVIDEITASAANISADLDRIADQVSGGLTEAEADDVVSQLTNLSSTLKTLADKNPEPTEGGGETPTEPQP